MFKIIFLRFIFLEAIDTEGRNGNISVSYGILMSLEMEVVLFPTQ